MSVLQVICVWELGMSKMRVFLSSFSNEQLRLELSTLSCW